MRDDSEVQELFVSYDMRSKDRLTAAKAYIKAGRKVLLTHGIRPNGRCTCGRETCPNPGKHPIAKFFPNGAKSATADLQFVKRALSAAPNANVAIVLDELTVVDTDGPEGRRAVDALQLPRTATVRTGRGSHRYFVGALSGGGFKA